VEFTGILLQLFTKTILRMLQQTLNTLNKFLTKSITIEASAPGLVSLNVDIYDNDYGKMLQLFQQRRDNS
jgi:hypothetical protein